MTPESYLNRRIASAVLIGIGGYLRSASSAEPQQRRDRYMRLVAPILPEVAAGAAARAGLRAARGEDVRQTARLSCLPAYGMVLSLIVYPLFIRSRISAGRQMKNAVAARRAGVVLSAAGQALKPEVKGRSQLDIVVALVAPVAGEAVEEALEKNHPTLGRIAGVAIAVSPRLSSLYSRRRKDSGKSEDA